MIDPLDEMRSAARAALPPYEGEIAVPGLDAPVEVLRDRWGVAYLSASSLEDLWFGQGFVQASERLFQIELALRAANGRLAQWFGEVSVPADRFARTVGLHRIGALEVERWSEGSRAMMRRFVDGARAWVAAMPAPPLEHRLLAVEPDLPEDLGPWAAVFALVAWGLSGNWDRELLRLRLTERFGDAGASALLPPAASGSPELTAATTAGLGAFAEELLDGLPRPSGQGSNNWVVAGSRTATGAPLLANDPHLLAGQPAAWFENHLRAPGYEVRGVAFPFAPGILIGTTGHHAWGLTNVSGDVQDLYAERLNNDRTAVEFDGQWEPVTVHPESIEVRGADAVVFDVLETRHGPILDTATVGVAGTEFEPLDGTLALRWTAVDGVVQPWTFVEMARARSFEEFRRAVRGFGCPGQNIVYADAGGTIGYQCTGRYPVRRAGDGSAPVPGWTSEHEWDDGWVPFEALPWSENPASGMIATANHRIHDHNDPHLLGLDFHPPFRAERIAEVLREVTPVSVEASVSLQVDTVSLPARRLLPLLLRTEGRSDTARWALELLRDWDGDLAAASTAAAVYEVWLGEIAKAAFGRGEDGGTFARYYAWREPFVCAALPALLERDEPLPAGGSWQTVLGSALEAALERLGERLGSDRDAWRWGALHHARFAHPMARLPGVGAIFVAADHEVGGDEQTVLQAGLDARLGFDAVVVPSWRFVTELGDPDATVAVLTTGQSGNPVSPHWNDQAELWASGRVRPAPFTRPAVEASAERSLVLVPG